MGSRPLMRSTSELEPRWNLLLLLNCCLSLKGLFEIHPSPQPMSNQSNNPDHDHALGRVAVVEVRQVRVFEAGPHVLQVRLVGAVQVEGVRGRTCGWMCACRCVGVCVCASMC